MFKKFSLIIIVMLIIPIALFAQSKSVNIVPQAIDIDEGTSVIPKGETDASVLKSAQLTWQIVDIMGNCYGMLSNRVKPFAYDPSSGALAFIHRGHVSYAASTGQLWYQGSTNNGTNWTRVSSLNTTNRNSSRYPSCALSNATSSSNPSDVLFTFAAPQLLVTGAGFGNFIYGVDVFMAAAPFSIEDLGDDTYWSNSSIWSRPGSPWIMWTTRRASPNIDFYFWRTQDYTTISAGVPPTWANANFSVVGLDIGGKYRNGTDYFATWCVWPGDDSTEYNFGYSKSTDNGATWSAWTRPQPGWRQATGAPLNEFLWDFGGAGSYSMDLLVDANNRVHFFGVVEDTLTLERKIYEVYETATGWANKVIQPNLKETTILSYEALNQMGNHLNAAISTDGNIMALYWLDAGTVAGDSLTDIWFSWRHITGNWSTPQNLTVTPNYAEMLLQVAPTLKFNGGNSYTAFIARCYETGVTTWPPVGTNTSDIFFAQHTFTITGVSDEQNIPQEFQLSQNYPNPFNPNTKINYSIPEKSNVSLKVYDILGVEVATLVNDAKEAGNYEVIFDASKIASGIYFYTLKTDKYSKSMKMVLMK